MAEFILKYWLEFAFGLVVAGLTFLAKRFYNLYKAEQKHQKTKEQEEFYKSINDSISNLYTRSKEDDTRLQGEIDDLSAQNETLQKGILSIQGKQFKADCRKLLEDGHEITIDEYKEIDEDHEAYNALGGNHTGDALFALVKKKAENTLTEA